MDDTESLEYRQECDEDDLESTRAELWGQIALQTIVNIVCELHGVITGAVHFYCDNIDLLVLNKLNPSKMAFPRYFKPNFDLKLLLQRLRDDCQKKVLLHSNHVKGHQDRQESFDYDTAPHPVRLNIDMDTLSKEFLRTNQVSLEPNQHQVNIPGQQATFKIGDKNVQKIYTTMSCYIIMAIN